MPKDFAIASEYGYLIHLLRCAIHEEDPCELPEGMSFGIVYRHAMEHDVANLAFYAVERLQEKPDAELYAQWGRRRDLALVRDMNQEFARQEIIAELESRGILYKEIQGTVLKKLYPRTEYRTMSDIDFIVEKSRLTECGEILSKLGYQCTGQDDFEIDGMRKPDIYVELHTDYFSPYTDYYDIMRDPFSHRALTEDETYTELYLYNIIHTAKHYFSSGCGIRRVLDMYFLDQCYGNKIDSDHVRQVLTESGLIGFAEELSYIARAWFGKADRCEDLLAMEQSIMSAGLHGKREYYINKRIRCVNKDEQITFGAKVKYLLSRVFPGVKVMKIKYPILRRVWILYPFCWVHRIIRMILGRNRKASVLDLRLVLQAGKEDL